jgi:hypothetical protein
MVYLTRFWATAAPPGGSTYGYYLGGANNVGTPIAISDRLTFSTDTSAAQTSANLSAAREFGNTMSDKSTYGYVCGGRTGAGGSVVTGDRITYSTSVLSANTVSNLSTSSNGGCGISDGTTYGYNCGGFTGDAAGQMTTGNRLTFSTGVMAAHTAANLSQARGWGGSVSDGSTSGYYIGGFTGGRVLTADRITFSTSVLAANTTSNYPQTTHLLNAISGNSTAGYFSGGYSSGSPNALTYKFTYSSGTHAAATTANLANGKGSHGNCNEGSTKGYFIGGTTGAIVATAESITYSTDTRAAATTANCSAARYKFYGLADGSV